MYKLVSEDLTHLGGPMGSEYTITNFTKYYSTEEKAKLAAEADYEGRIKWKSSFRKDGITSGDMGYVMYTIEEVKMED